MIRLPFFRFPEYKREEDPDYGYACGRIRAIETGLIERARFERLKELKTAEEVLKNLHDTYYGKYVQHIEKPEDFVKIEREARNEAIALMKALLKPVHLKELLMENDFRNLKIALKYFIKEDLDNARGYYEETNLPFSLLKIGLAEDKVYMLPSPYKDALVEALESYFEKHEVRKIDIVIERFFYQKVVPEFRSDFLKTYYRVKADFINILGFIRLELMERRELFKEYAVGGGYIPVKTLLDLEDISALSKALEPTAYYPYLKDGLQAVIKSNEVLLLEKGYDAYLLDFLRTTKLIDMGHEPVVAYYLARIMEFKALKIILTAKLVGLEQNYLDRRLAGVF